MIKEDLHDRLELTVGEKNNDRNKKLDEGHTVDLTRPWKSNARQPEGSSGIYHAGAFKRHI